MCVSVKSTDVPVLLERSLFKSKKGSVGELSVKPSVCSVSWLKVQSLDFLLELKQLSHPILCSTFTCQSYLCAPTAVFIQYSQRFSRFNYIFCSVEAQWKETA